MIASAPRLRSDLSFTEQVYRGERSFVVKDVSAQRYFRFGATEARVMRAFDGQRTPREIATLLAAESLRISAAAIEQFARTLAGSGLLERTMAERTVLQMERVRAERRTRRRARLFRGELTRMRWSFGDPDALLTRSLPFIRWMFTPAFLVASVVLFAGYLIVLGQQWPAYVTALRSTYSLQSITLGNVAVLTVTGLVVVLIHELGHGYTCKFFGGEVHELGFMLLYFQPAFYCNVSDAWSFPDRRARLWVTAAGSWIQLVVAAVAALVWWAAAPGSTIAEICAAAMLIGGVMTLLTNMNPLLPLDGYFALSDWLEIPNLRQRASEHFRWWVQRTLFCPDLAEPSASPRERRVFLTYGALSAVYVMLTLGVSAAFLFRLTRQTVGWPMVLVIGGAVLLAMRDPITTWSRSARISTRTLRSAWRRRLVSSRAAAVFAVVVIAGLLVPWTITSTGEFVARPAVARVVTPEQSGLVAEVLVSEGMRMAAGTPIIRIADRALDRDVLETSRSEDSLALAEAAARAAGRGADADLLAARRRVAEDRLDALDRRSRALMLRAPIAGAVLTRHPESLVGRRVRSGDSLLVLGTPDSVEVRIALDGANSGRVRTGQLVHLVSYADAATPTTARVSSVSSAATGANSARGPVEARVRMASGDAWRPGVRGEARVDVGRSTVVIALLAALRSAVRPDLGL